LREEEQQWPEVQEEMNRWVMVAMVVMLQFN
jgi:hypothetical protein